MMIPAIWTAIHVNMSTPEALRALAGLGWRCFELSTEHLEQLEAAADRPARIAEVRRTLADLGATMPQAHALLNADVAHPDLARRQTDRERLARHIDIAADLGVRTVVIHPGRGAGYTTRREYDGLVATNVEAFRRLADCAGDRGLRIGLENLMDGPDVAGRRHFGAAPLELLDLLDRLGHAALGITLDTSHANVQRLDLVAAIREFGPHLVATHISDNDGSGDQHRTPGSGRIDWPAVVRTLHEVGYSGPFNLEIPGERHPVPEIQALKIRHAREVAEWLVGLTKG